MGLGCIVGVGVGVGVGCVGWGWGCGGWITKNNPQNAKTTLKIHVSLQGFDFIHSS